MNTNEPDSWFCVINRSTTCDVCLDGRVSCDTAESFIWCVSSPPRGLVRLREGSPVDGGQRGAQGKSYICISASNADLKFTDSEIVIVHLAFWDDSCEQDRSWDDFGTTISGMYGTHQHCIGSRMPIL